MDIKLGKVLTYGKKFQSLKRYDPLIMWHTRSRDKLKNLYFQYQKTYDQ